MSNFFHHLDLTVIDPVKSRPLYELFLGHLGFTLKSAGDEWAGFGLSDKRYPCITLLKAKGRNAARKHDRYSSGLHHLSLRAKSKEDVDALYKKLKKFGATILDPPAEYADYGKGYYAVFFADPDGLKLEYAFTPPSAEVRV
ncbi:MAG: VOC family protein [Hyphomonadaceae bacterium]|nr:VOC family protein [Hyphomonadaceae bacterium]